ncbi:hypothetical protein HanPI659440_Chr02g0036211 [Helianthus annuus]|nr:hypothetical protein HanPI659440_Chr02g0036211 [Helianthus annuus]
MEFLQSHDTTYLELLGNVCSGEDRTLGSMGTKGSMKNRKFWLNFAMTLCRNTRSDYQEGLEVTCQQYCERLRKTHKRLTSTNFYSVHAPAPLTPFLNQLNRIFGVGRPSTSEGSLRSRGSISSGTSQSEWIDTTVNHEYLLMYGGNIRTEKLGSPCGSSTVKRQLQHQSMQITITEITFSIIQGIHTTGDDEYGKFYKPYATSIVQFLKIAICATSGLDYFHNKRMD